MSPVSTNTTPEPEIHSMQQVVHRRQRQVVPPDAMKNVVDLIMEERMGVDINDECLKLLSTWDNFSQMVKVLALVFCQLVAGECTHPRETSRPEEVILTCLSPRISEASYCSLQWI